MKGKLAIIGAGGTALLIAKKAKEMDISTYCFAWPEGAIAKDFVDHFYPISIFDMDDIVKICKDNNIGGVVPTTELTIAVCSYVAEKLGCPVNVNYENAVNITNKGWVRDKNKDNKLLLNPAYLKTHTYDNIKWDIFPAIVKPSSEGAKRGVIVARNSEEMNNAFEYAKSFDKRDNGVMIEQYLEGGKELSVECLSYCGKHQVIQITEKITSGPPHCVELGHHQPADIPDNIVSRIKSAMSVLLDSVSFKNGITHTEIKVIEDEVYLIELNSRPGGDFIADTLTPLSTGYDLFAEGINAALGIEPKPFSGESIKYSGVYFVTKQTEFLKPIFDSCDNEEWLYEKHVENGELNELLNNSGSSQNYFIYCSDKRIDFHK